MSIKTFSSSQAESSKSDEVAPDITVQVDDREVTFLGPNSTETTLLLMQMSGSKSMFQSVAASLDVILGMVEDAEDRRWLERRLLDRNDPLGIETVTDIVLYLIEEWFARPTQEQPASSGSPSRTGKKSTGQRHRKASGHSTSHQSAS